MKNVKPSLKSDTVASEETQSELDTNMLPDVISSEGNAAGSTFFDGCLSTSIFKIQIQFPMFGDFL